MREWERLFHESPDMQCVTSPDGELLSVNPRLAAQLGIRSLRSCFHYVLEADQQTVRLGLGRAIAGTPVGPETIRCRTAANDLMAINWSAQAGPDPNTVIATGRLARHMLTDAARVSVVVLDRDNRIIHYNRGFADLTGRPLTTTVGRDWHDFFAKADSQERAADRLSRTSAIHRTATSSSIRSIRTVDGAERLIEWYDSPLERHGEVQLLSIGIDVSERERAAQAIAEREAHLNDLLDTTIEGVITLDDRGVIESLGPTARELFGWPHGAPRGIHLNELLADPSAGPTFPINPEHSVTTELTGRRQDGSTFPIEVMVRQRDERSKPIVTIRDLSAQRQSMESQRSADRLTLLGTLAAGLGHDMNNLLLPMRSHLSVLDQTALPDQAREHVNAVSSAVEYMQYVTDALHLLSSDPAPTDSPPDEGTHLLTWWTKVQPILLQSMHKSARLTAWIPADLPAVGVGEHELTRAMLNLLVNAGEAVGDAGNITVWAEHDHDRPIIRLAVADDGPGMSPEVLRQAFDPFFTTKRRSVQTGLGLPLVRAALAAVDGDVHIDSAVGQGTTVTLELPITTRTTPAARRSVRLTLDNTRLHALAASVVRSAGLHVAGGDEPHDVWIFDEPHADPAILNTFLQRGVGVACGTLLEEEHRRLFIVRDPSNFAELRDTMARAFASACEEIS